MRSKTSCFNSTLFRKNLSRYWPLWGLASFGGAMFPLAMLLELLHNGFRFWSPLETRQAYYTVLSYGVPVISIVYAILCAMAVWSYLYNARSVGMMHTLPVRREGLFVTNVLSGLTMMAIPYAVTGVLLVLVSLLFGGFEPVGVLVTVLGVMGESLFFFGLATFCAFIVGNVFMLPTLYGLLNFIAVLTDFMVNLLAQGFCFGLNSSYSGTVEWLSPVVYLIQKISPNSTYETQWVTDRLGGQRYETSVLTSVTLENGWLIAAYAAAGAALLGLAWLLYRRRRSESAGDVVAVGWMKPVFRYGCAVYAAILGGRLLYALLWESFQSGQYFTLLPYDLVHDRGRRYWLLRGVHAAGENAPGVQDHLEGDAGGGAGLRGPVRRYEVRPVRRDPPGPRAGQREAGERLRRRQQLLPDPREGRRPHREGSDAAPDHYRR